MSGNQLRLTLCTHCTLLPWAPSPHCTLATLTASCLDLGSATGRINMKSLGLFLFRLNASWQGLAGGLLLWLMGIPEASDFMSIPWNKNSVPGVNENFLTQITQTSTVHCASWLLDWTSCGKNSRCDVNMVRPWRGVHWSLRSDQADTPVLTLDSEQIMNSSASIDFMNFTSYFTDWHATETIHSPYYQL